MVLLVLVFSFCRLCFKYHPYSSYVSIHSDVIYKYKYKYLLLFYYYYFCVTCIFSFALLLYVVASHDVVL
jgi:hypothetical protein